MKIKHIVICSTIFIVAITIMLIARLSSSPIKIPEGASIYTDESALEMFQDVEKWSMTDLLQQEVYLLNDEINIDFWFDRKATAHQIDNARSFAITTFVLKHISAWSPYPYERIIIDDMPIWKTVSCRVYKGNELLYHERYDEHNQLIK